MRNLAIAALCLILPQPETILDPSFQMSFSAVVALMTAYEWAHEWRNEHEGAAYYKRKRRDKLTGWRAWVAWGFASGTHILRETLAATTIATIAIAPYTVYTFHRVAVYGILANLVAVPLFNVVIMPLVALALAAMPFGLEAWPLTLVDRWVEVLMWIARSVSALPGAVILVPQMPVAALAVMTLGAAWLCLWRHGWRYLGLAGVALGMLLAVRGQPPDILIGAEGHPIAVRLADGRLSGLPARSGAFELSQWLQADADGRDPSAIETGTGFRCDSLGCTALVHGEVVAISDDPASLRDDCANAKIVILRYRQPGPCVGPALVIDIRDLRIGGVHAVTLGKTGPQMTSVAAERGDRPWSRTVAMFSRSSELDDIATPGWQRLAPSPGQHKKRPSGIKQQNPTIEANAGPGAVPSAISEPPKRHRARKSVPQAVHNVPLVQAAAVPAAAVSGPPSDPRPRANGVQPGNQSASTKAGAGNAGTTNDALAVPQLQPVTWTTKTRRPAKQPIPAPDMPGTVVAAAPRSWRTGLSGLARTRR
jgi:Competence protein